MSILLKVKKVEIVQEMHTRLGSMKEWQRLRLLGSGEFNETSFLRKYGNSSKQQIRVGDARCGVEGQLICNYGNRKNICLIILYS
jgi:hypothetical protein